jgi:hypothetical protein
LPFSFLLFSSEPNFQSLSYFLTRNFPLHRTI